MVWLPDAIEDTSQNLLLRGSSEAQFIVPDWGDKVNFGIGLSYRSVRPHRLAGRYDNPMLKST
jgi:hypothetical protein